MSGSVGAAGTSTGSTAAAAAAAAVPPPSASTPTTPMDANASAEEELEETVSRLFSHPGVQAVIILNRAGDVLVERTTAALRRASSSSSSGAPDDSSDAVAAAGADMHASSQQQQQQQHVLPKRLNQMLNSVRGLLRALPDPQHGASGGGGDDIGFMQIRSADGGREIMVAPHQGYVLAVMKMAAET
jgi:hypothetical protein